MPKKQVDTTAKAIQAGLLSWVLPGAGHFWLGQRSLALVMLVGVSLPYLIGLAVGGVTNSVNPRSNKWLFLAELGVGGYTVPGYFVSQRIERALLRDLDLPAIPTEASAQTDIDRWDRARSPFVAYYPESDIAQIYLATAGLLNLLVILDAISRAQTGLPTYHRDLPTEETA